MEHPISVKRFLDQVKACVEPKFAKVCIKGEVSNFRPSGKHWYFTLKDDGAALSCAVWLSQQKHIAHPPANGDQVIVTGGLNLYAPGGSITLIVSKCDLGGVGDFSQRLRQLESMLRTEGAFDKPKKALPRMPKRIAVIAANGGAALQDILEVTRKRAPGIDILIFPASAQGDCCVPENLMALQEAQDEYWGCDVIIMARGGGSVEDLWGYNDPTLVRSVSECRLPIITGVGHEIDVTLVDLASDRRAATPSQAAELATPDRNALLQGLARKKDRMSAQMDRLLDSLEATLNMLTDQGLIRIDPLLSHQQRFERLALRLERAAPHRRLETVNMDLALLRQRLWHAGRRTVEAMAIGAKQHESRLHAAMGHALDRLTHRLGVTGTRLGGLNPIGPLDKGFVLVYDHGKRQVKTSSEAAASPRVRLRWKDGEKWATIE